MLTYDLSLMKGPLYQSLYECIKNDILLGNLSKDTKLPSKRTFAKNMGISTITIENTYELLLAEGYIYSIPQKGYYVAKVEPVYHQQTQVRPEFADDRKREEYLFDFSSNRTNSSDFPFSIWSKLMKETMSMRDTKVLEKSPGCGIWDLREAISNHLYSFRGLVVDPNQIIIGAGTEYLYGLLIALFEDGLVYGIENPGYNKLKKIYEIHHAKCCLVNMDEKGILIPQLRQQKIDVAHISPNHHFPTGITMPLNRRYEILEWASEDENRYIIEDDYDSEFRVKGKPIPTLFSVDQGEKVIYMNTFSKSLTPTIRISYMILPKHLMDKFYEKLGFYACTVSTFEQLTLANFIKRGYFEKHINRMRLQYGRKRAKVLEIIHQCFHEGECKVIENDSGLHFILELDTKKEDRRIEEELLAQGIKISAITDYLMDDQNENLHQFILNYSNLDLLYLETALKKLVL